MHCTRTVGNEKFEKKGKEKEKKSISIGELPRFEDWVLLLLLRQYRERERERKT
jgi:hypothetical protein